LEIRKKLYLLFVVRARRVEKGKRPRDRPFRKGKSTGRWMRDEKGHKRLEDIVREGIFE
jgi:hypothetical protein